MSSQSVIEPVIEPMEIEVQSKEVRDCLFVDVCIVCYVQDFGLLLCYLLVFIVVIQGEVLPDTDVFRDVVISNVSV